MPAGSNLNPARLAVKALLLFVIVNLVFAVLNPPIGRLVFPHRYHRFPSIWTPTLLGEGRWDFSPTMFSDLDLLFGAHIVSASAKPAQEYRVFLLGDSSIWGAFLPVDETQAFLLNGRQLETCSGRQVRVYNFGFPFNSTAKDLLILSETAQYEPDLVIWFFSLQALTPDRQSLDFVTENPARVYDLAQAHAPWDAYSAAVAAPSRGLWAAWWERTLIGRRKQLGLALRLQLSGLVTAMLGTDEPRGLGKVSPVQHQKLTDSQQYLEYLPPVDLGRVLAFDSLRAGQAVAGEIPLVFVNEPIYRRPGKNGKVRYNEIYPRWAYDQYRELMSAYMEENGWTYYDLWDVLPPEEFSNSVFHRTPEGERLLAEQVQAIILENSCGP